MVDKRIIGLVVVMVVVMAVGGDIYIEIYYRDYITLL